MVAPASLSGAGTSPPLCSRHHVGSEMPQCAAAALARTCSGSTAGVLSSPIGSTATVSSGIAGPSPVRGATFPGVAVFHAHAQPRQVSLRLGGLFVVALKNGLLQPCEPVRWPVAQRRMKDTRGHRVKTPGAKRLPLVE